MGGCSAVARLLCSSRSSARLAVFLALNLGFMVVEALVGVISVYATSSDPLSPTASAALSHLGPYACISILHAYAHASFARCVLQTSLP